VIHVPGRCYRRAAVWVGRPWASWRSVSTSVFVVGDDCVGVGDDSIWGFNAHAPLFRSGWFVESLATQSLISFAVRTRRVPFFHSTPSTPPALATMICVAIGVLLSFSPLAHVLGFVPLPAGFLAALAAMIVFYLVLVELGKIRFYRARPPGSPLASRQPPPNTGYITAPPAGASRAARAAQRPPTNPRRERRSRHQRPSPRR
jgi:P-type Mg2+ transporter